MVHLTETRLNCVRTRLIVPILAMLSLLSQHAGAEQRLRAPLGGATSVSPDEQPKTRLPTPSRRTVRLHRTALERLEAKQFDDAIVYFQAILDAEVDGFIESDGRFVSLRGEVIRHLDSPPAEVGQTYERRYGHAAKGLLEEALAEGDLTKLAEVTWRFPATEAGRRAAYRLAVAHLDRGEPLAAARRFESLLDHGSAEHRANLLFRLAQCYHRCGDNRQRDSALQELLESNIATIVIAGQPVKIADSDRDELISLLIARTSEETSFESPVAGGNPARTNYREATAGLKSDWAANGLPNPFGDPEGPRSETVELLHRWAAQTSLVRLAEGQPAALVSRPVASKGTIYFKTPANVTALDITTGKTHWRSLADPLAWGYLSESSIRTTNGEAAGRTLVGQRLWDDQTWGSLATDGRIVFAVEETGTATPLPALPVPPVRQVAGQPTLPSAFNRLVAYAADTGRRIWEAGGDPADQLPLSGTFFLGAPAPAANHWFVLGESNGITHLYALEPTQSGGVLWSQPIADHDSTIEHNPQRRTGGYSPTYLWGLLFCPVEGGGVVAIDPAARSLLWAYVPQPQQVTPGGLGLEAQTVPESTQVIASSDVVLTGVRGAHLTALRPSDGNVLWTTEQRGNLWIIAVYDWAAFLQVPTGVTAVRLSDGTAAWPRPAAIGPPAGRGVAVGSRLFIPLTDSSIAVLEIATGKLLGTIPSPEGKPLGNLIVSAGSLISQSATKLIAIPVPD